MTAESSPPAERKFDPANPRHWLLVAVFVAQLVIFFRGGGPAPTPPDLNAMADVVAAKVVAEQAMADKLPK